MRYPLWLSAKVTLKVKKIKIKTADNCGGPVLRPVHTKDDKDNYKSNDISVRISGQYCLFILSTRFSSS